MAGNSTPVISALKKMLVGDVKNNQANSEAINAKLSANINALIDQTFYQEQVRFHGFFESSSYDNGYGGHIRVKGDTKIVSYEMYVRNNGVSGSNILNFQIKDTAGGVIGNLFGSGADRLLIGTNTAKTDSLIGKIVETDTNYSNNVSGLTVQYGDLNYTTLLDGWLLVPFIESNGKNAYNMTFKMALTGA